MAITLRQEIDSKTAAQAITLPVHFEFTSPKIKQTTLTTISPTRSPWDAHVKRKEIIENHQVNFVAIMNMLHVDGYVKTAVAKYVNSIFLRGYKNYTLKNNIDKYLKMRLQMIIDAMPDHNHLDDFFQAIAKDLVAYANVYLLKTRAKQPVLPKGIKALKGVPFLKSNGKKEPQDPIASYEILHPATIHIIRDRNANLVRYEQWPMGVKNRPENKDNIRTWKPQEIIHIRMDKEDGYPYGTPALDAVIDDVRLLRTLEDSASKLAYRYAFPFTQVKVGDTKPGFAATEEEIKYYRNLVENAPPDATLVTNEKVKFEVVGVQGQAIDLKPYLEHFEDRLFSGLQISAVSMGRGDTANRNTADAMSVEMHDQIKHFQNILSRNITGEIYRELLLEAGFDWYADPDKNWVELQFEEIEIESKIKQEQHALSMVQGGILSISEGRIRIGEQPFTDEEWKDSYLMKWLLPQDMMKKTGAVDLDQHGDLNIERHNAEMEQMDAKTELTKAQTAQTKKATDQAQAPEGPSETTTAHHVVTTGGGKKTVKRTIQVQRPASTGGKAIGRPGGPATTLRGTTFKLKPANQHGQRTGPKRSTETESVSSFSVDVETRATSYAGELKNLFSEMKMATLAQVQGYLNDPLTSRDEPPMMDFLFQLIEMRLKTLSSRYLMPAFNAGWQELESQTNKSRILPVHLERHELEQFNDSTIKRLIGDISRNVTRLLAKESLREDIPTLLDRISGVFGILEYRLTLIANSELPQAFWYGYATAAAMQGIRVSIVNIEEDSCVDCLDLHGHVLEINMSPTARLAAVPPRHPQCNCGLTPLEDEAEEENTHL